MFVSCNSEVTSLFCAFSVNLFCFHFFPYAMMGASVHIRLENILFKIIRSLMSQKGFYFDYLLEFTLYFYRFRGLGFVFPYEGR